MYRPAKYDNIIVEPILRSTNPAAQELTTFRVTCPRWILAEINTHRNFSRNCASSRAIPVEKLLEKAETDPAMFEYWGANKPGMQAGAELGGEDLRAAVEEWMDARDSAVRHARNLASLGLHKQNANRLLEPFIRVTDLITSTEWDNFFGLRAHKDAQPEFQVMAFRMLHAHLNWPEDKLQHLEWGEWHLPLDDGQGELQDRIICSVANAARTSYTPRDSEFSIEKQRGLHDGLPLAGHWSPFEHQAQADQAVTASGNFRGHWLQLRHTYPNQVRKPDLQELLDAKPDWIEI